MLNKIGGNRNRAVLCGAICTFILAGFAAFASPALAEEPVSPPPGSEVETVSVPAEPLNYDRCVRFALDHSPYVQGSSLEIKVRRLDEDDSRWAMAPSLSVSWRYYLNTPDSDSDRYRFGFFIDDYNPIRSWYTLKARKLLTSIAVLTHTETLSRIIDSIGETYLELEALDRLAKLQGQVVELAEDNIAFTMNRLSSGNVAIIETRIAEQEAEVARLSLAEVAAKRKAALQDLRVALGLNPDDAFEPDLDAARAQVLGDYDFTGTTLDQVTGNSLALKMKKHTEALQRMRISLAYAAYLPTFTFSAETNDPIQSTNGEPAEDNDELYFSAGLKWKLWDGLSRWRDINRQEILLRKAEGDSRLTVTDLKGRWQSARSAITRAQSDLKMARAQEDLLFLKVRRAEISFQSGTSPYSEFIAAQKDHVAARKNTILKELALSRALLDMRHLSGALWAQYVDISDFQE